MFLRLKIAQKSEKWKLTKGTCKNILHEFHNIDFINDTNTWIQ